MGWKGLTRRDEQTCPGGLAKVLSKDEIDEAGRTSLLEAKVNKHFALLVKVLLFRWDVSSRSWQLCLSGEAFYAGTAETKTNNRCRKSPGPRVTP